MPTTPEAISAIIQNNWNDQSTGVAKNDIEWPATRKELIELLRTSTKNYFVACYCATVRETQVAQDTWRVDEPITVDIYLKSSEINFTDMIALRTTMRNEVKRIIHAQQIAVSGVSLAWITAENAIEHEGLLRQVLSVNCMYFHVKT